MAFAHIAMGKHIQGMRQLCLCYWPKHLRTQFMHLWNMMFYSIKITCFKTKVNQDCTRDMKCQMGGLYNYMFCNWTRLSDKGCLRRKYAVKCINSHHKRIVSFEVCCMSRMCKWQRLMQTRHMDVVWKWGIYAEFCRNKKSGCTRRMLRRVGCQDIERWSYKVVSEGISGIKLWDAVFKRIIFCT
jgi:hypothetical protein